MRGVTLTLLFVLASVPLLPAAGASGERHYGGLFRGCGPEGLIDTVVVDCANPVQAGYVEQAGCDGDVCALRFWHEAAAMERGRERAMTVEAYFAAGLAQTPLCSASGVATWVACEVNAHLVSFTLASGCTTVEAYTLARAEDLPLTGRTEASFLICREQNDVWFGDASQTAWTNGSGSGCARELLTGCQWNIGGWFGAEACTMDSCDIAFSGWGLARDHLPTARAIRTSLEIDGRSIPGCIAAGVGLYTSCESVAHFDLAIRVGECVPFTLTLLTVDGRSPTTREYEASLCRESDRWLDVPRP